jgi:hypothetical protein
LLAAACGGGGHHSPATLSFHSRPDLAPPVVTVTKSSPAAAPGDIFIAPKQNALEKGPEILDAAGRPLWFNPVAGQATDFREQTYRGKPVLTWWQGPPEAPVLGTGLGHGVIVDSSYRLVATVDAGFGKNTADLHEFQLTPRGTALLTAYRIVATKSGKVADSIVREVDVATGKPLFTWHSLGHVALSESYSHPDAKHPFDYFHVNSVEEEPDGNFLVSARNTHAVYEVDKQTGAVLWRLGGKKSSFRMGPGANFAWQHDARRQSDGTITIFDDEAAPAVGKQSRAIRLRLDMGNHTATLVHADANGTLAGSQGNVEQLANGDLFVGWGAIPRITEFAPDGTTVFDATFADGDDSYRGYRFAWTATPATRPAIAVAKDGKTVWASWNGATQVARWQVVGGVIGNHLTPIAAVAKRGFETAMTLRSTQPYLAVEALDGQGHVLARSAVVTHGGLAVG